MLEQCGSQQEDAVLAYAAGRARAVVLLLEDDPFEQGRIASAEFLGPGDDGVAGIGECVLPLTVLFEAFGGIHRLQGSRGHIRFQERANLVTECGCGVVEYEIH